MVTSRTNFQIKSFRPCNGSEGLFKYKVNLLKENGNYYVDGYVIIDRFLDGNIGVSFINST